MLRTYSLNPRLSRAAIMSVRSPGMSISYTVLMRAGRWMDVVIRLAQTQQGGFPFLYVQLANYMPARREPGESTWAELREAQRQEAMRRASRAVSSPWSAAW